MSCDLKKAFLNRNNCSKKVSCQYPIKKNRKMEKPIPSKPQVIQRMIENNKIM